MADKNTPFKLPRPARWLLARIVRHDDYGYAEGDLSEMFESEASVRGRGHAWRWFFSEALRSFPAFFRTNMTWGLIMLKNYIKVTLRNMKRFKGYTFINLTGLAIGLTCSILILLWVRDEMSYDRFHENSSALHRIYLKGRYSDASISAFLSTPGPLAPALKADIPEIVDTSRFLRVEQTLVSGDKRLTMAGCFVDPSFLDMFTFPSLDKNARASLSGPNSMVLTEEAEERLFGDDVSTGKTVQIKDWFDLNVSGVITNIPENSHIQFDFLLPFKLLERFGLNLEDWGTQNYITYVQLQGNITLENVEAKVQGFLQKNRPDSSYTLHLQPLTQIHLHDYKGGGPINSVYIFTAVAILILLIACINFINLSTARSLVRAKEVRMRKTVGARRGQIVKQFVLESLFFAFLSYCLAIILMRVFQPVFNNLAGKQLTLDLLDYRVVLGSAAIIVLIGIGAGIYPAFFLSSFTPAHVLKGAHKSGSNGSLLRKALVIFQFSISILLMVCVLVVFSQLGFIKHKDLGMGRENVLSFQLTGNLSRQYDPLKAEILKNPGVQSVTRISNLPIQRRSSDDSVSWEGKQDTEKILMHFLFVDSDFDQTFEVKMAEGKFFSEHFQSETFQGFVVNQTAVKAMGLESPLGKTLEAWDLKGQILGVVRDFHFRSFHNLIEPLILVVISGEYHYLCVKIKGENLAQTLTFLEKTIKRFDPGYTYGFLFLEEEIENLYRAEQSGSNILGYFTVLAIFISCLGLFGLALFLTDQKTKEIGIRRVLGASVFSIIRQLTKDFSKWVLLANIIAWPVSYIAMNRWLQNFAYKTPIRIWFFFSSAVLALVIALLTVGYQSIKAARSNPVKSLRYE
jgi:putative ABC transport system permease protein